METSLRLAAALALLGSVACTGTVGPPGGDDDGAGTVDGGGGPDEFTDAAVCDQSTPVEITPAEPPDLLLVVDKSGSMSEPLGTGEQKWQVMRSALTGVVTEYGDGINFGLMLYPDGDVCDAGNVLAGVSPTSGTAIQLALLATQPSGGTPTHTTMTAALTYYSSVPVNPHGRYALLATDGQPNCLTTDDPNIPTVTQSIAAITALANAGIPVFVLGFGGAVNSDPTTLQAMATAGGTGAYYAANSPAELQAALEAIAGAVGVPDCTFSLTGTPADPDRLGVYFDDIAVPRNPSHVDGWDYDPATNSITFYGASCSELQSGGVNNVRVDYGCGGPVVP